MSKSEDKGDPDEFRRLAPIELKWADADDLPTQSYGADWQAAGYAGNIYYQPIPMYSLDFLEQICQMEASIIDSLEPYTSDEISGIELEDEFDEMRPRQIPPLDLGVCAATLSLAALGCIPVSSCNGGAFSNGHQEDFPLIAFHCNREHFLLLRSLLNNMEVAIDHGAGGALIMYARDARDIVSAANTIITALKQETRAPDHND